MLELKLFCFREISGPHYRLRGTITALSGGRFVTYVAELFDHHGQLFARGLLRDHPRWSEPLTAIVARCLDAALAGLDLARWFDYERATLGVSLHGQVLINDLNCSRELEQVLGDDSQPKLFDSPTPPNVWEVVRLACAADAWGEPYVPRMPEPLQPAVYQHEGVRYCRSSELPDEAQWALDRCAFGQHRPLVAGVPDAVFESEMNHFLGVVT
jgi:hypothetical protein